MLTLISPAGTSHIYSLYGCREIRKIKCVFLSVVCEYGRVSQREANAILKKDFIGKIVATRAMARPNPEEKTRWVG